MTKEEYFKAYPSSKECFQTSDVFFFHKDFDAAAHALSLEDKTVWHFKRDEQVAENAENEATAEPKVLERKTPKKKLLTTN